MSLTPTQQTAIRSYLGYPDLNRYKDPRLEGILTGTVLSPEAETRIAALLANLATVDARLGTTILTGAGVKRVNEIEFFQNAAIQNTFTLGRTYITQLSNILGVPIYGDYYGQQGYPGDSYSSGGLGRPGGGPRGGGGVIPLG